MTKHLDKHNVKGTRYSPLHQIPLEQSEICTQVIGRLICKGAGRLVRTGVGWLVGGGVGKEVGLFSSEGVGKLVGEGVGDLVSSRVGDFVGIFSSGRVDCLPPQLPKAMIQVHLKLPLGVMTPTYMMTL